MNPAGPILRDIHPPPPPSWWPPAYGWWLLAGMLVAVLAAILLWGRRRMLRHYRLRSITRQIEQAREHYRHTGDTAGFAGTLSQWLRRAGRLLDTHAVQLEGEAWRSFVRGHAPRGVDVAVLESLDMAVYRPEVTIDDQAAVAAVHAWVRHALARA